MAKLEFSIEINASAEDVWQIIVGKESYEQWAACFFEESLNDLVYHYVLAKLMSR
jgi:uncharacterized protein YndB with AHSA1/START domain